jgi:hypothetical protein
VAQATPFLGTSTTVDPIVVAMTPGANTVSFTAIWRGLTVAYDAPNATLTVDVRHSQANAPLTLAGEVTPPAGPFVSFPFGEVWTSVLAPLPTLVVYDGLGLVGAPNPAITTDAGGVYTLTLAMLPALGGTPVRIQAYALDTTKTTLELFMISNRVDATLL